MSIHLLTENDYYLTFFIYLFCILLLCLLLISIGFFLGEKSYSKSRNIPFESGINPIGSNKLRSLIKFYLLAVFFVIFDVEAIYLYSWSIVIREVSWLGFIQALIFIISLISGLIYIIKTGIINSSLNKTIKK